jgi:hypothetical protein
MLGVSLIKGSFVEAISQGNDSSVETSMAIAEYLLFVYTLVS